MPGPFRGPGGVRSGWRVLLFAALIVALVFAIAWGVAHLPWKLDLRAGDKLTPWFMLLNDTLLLVPVLLATLLMTRLEDRPVLSVGLRGPRRFRLFLWGLALGIALLVALVLVLAASGLATIGGGSGAGRDIFFGIAWFAASLLIGFTEEFTFRGYILQAFARGLGFWPAALITSLIFAGLHYTNSGEGLIGLAQIFLLGMLLCYGIKLTGSLWWAIGLHTGWDYAENFILGTHDSGQACLGTLLDTLPHGPAWLSGGITGPEGSAIGLFVPPLAAFALRAAFDGRQG